MISIVMFGHALLPYLTVPRSFKDPQTHVAFDVLAVFLYGFALHAFFVTAGFSAAALQHRRGANGLLKNRFRRIFLPLLIAFALLSPLTRGAYSFAKHTANSGSIQTGIDVLMLGEWIRWGKAYHLWFLVALLLYTVLAVGLRRGLLQFAHGFAGWVRDVSRRMLASRWCAPLFALLIGVSTVPAYIFYDGDANTAPMLLTLFGYFVLGWLLYLHRDLLPSLRGRALASFAIAIIALPIAVWSTRQRLFAPDETDLVIGFIAGITNSILSAFMTFGLLSMFVGRMDRPSAFGRYVSDASYWIFLIHFPLLIAVAGFLSVTPFNSGIKYLLTVGIVVPVVIATYHYGVRRTRLGGAEARMP